MAVYDRSQRKAQLTSALRHLNARKPFYKIVCGDFNEPVHEGSEVREALCKDALVPTMSVGGTHSYGLTLDHVWAGSSLQPIGVLGTPHKVLTAMFAEGFPNAEHLSDHLPVGAHFKIEDEPQQAMVMFERPVDIDASVLQEWVATLWTANSNAPKQARKKQRKLENTFLANLGEIERAQL